MKSELGEDIGGSILVTLRHLLNEQWPRNNFHVDKVTHRNVRNEVWKKCEIIVRIRTVGVLNGVKNEIEFKLNENNKLEPF